MESEGPYRTGDATCIVFRVGVGEAENFDSERDALNASRLANTAYAEGRKSMEKELVELLEFVNRIMEFFKHYTYCPRCKSDIDHIDEVKYEGGKMSEIKNHVGVPIHDAIMDIYEQIQLLHKRIDDFKEEINMIRAGKGEK